jgi:hypothetical protein
MGKTDKEVVALRASLASAKAEIEKLRSKPLQNVPSTPAPVANVNTDQSNKIKALQNELAKANAAILQLQNSAKTPAVQEKIVTKVVEPTEKNSRVATRTLRSANDDCQSQKYSWR